MMDDTAKRRFFLINIVRLSGLVMVLIALAIYYGRINAPVEAAYVLAVLGVIEFFFMPQYLSRKWRTRDR